MATDSDWEELKSRAEAAGMDVSRFIAHRLSAPEPDQAASMKAMDAALVRIERAVGVLFEVEKQRLSGNGEDETWEALVRRADLLLERERLL